MPTPGTMRCKHCGYDLIGLSSHRCPECGEPFDPNDPEPFSGIAQLRQRPVRRTIGKALFWGFIVAGCVFVIVFVTYGTTFLLWMRQNQLSTMRDLWLIPIVAGYISAIALFLYAVVVVPILGLLIVQRSRKARELRRTD